MTRDEKIVDRRWTSNGWMINKMDYPLYSWCGLLIVLKPWFGGKINKFSRRGPFINDKQMREEKKMFPHRRDAFFDNLVESHGYNKIIGPRSNRRWRAGLTRKSSFYFHTFPES